jgi:hypothetical protein
MKKEFFLKKILNDSYDFHTLPRPRMIIPYAFTIIIMIPSNSL